MNTFFLLAAGLTSLWGQDSEQGPVKIKSVNPSREQARIQRMAQAAKSREKALAKSGAPEVREAILTAAIPMITVTPCRLFDSRNPVGTFGGPVLAGGSTRVIPIPQSGCSIPSTAQAYSLNITVVPRNTLGYLSVWPAGSSQPLVSTLNSFDGQVVSNAAVVPSGTNGAINVFVTDTTDVIVDINAYFASGSGASFFSLTPCRVADTRLGSGKTGAFGAPSPIGGTVRSMPIPQSGCQVPSDAVAYSLNVTVVPLRPLSYLTVFPTGGLQPLVSTLNSFSGAVVANAAIVPAGQEGAVSFFVTDTTDLVVDINGYFR
ncbi:MAG: hypothetical protein HY820_38090 [Acidobacteria bacterium]|nr:hypothetical protein [Acidobacteriota bacterium]